MSAQPFFPRESKQCNQMLNSHPRSTYCWWQSSPPVASVPVAFTSSLWPINIYRHLCSLAWWLCLCQSCFFVFSLLSHSLLCKGCVRQAQHLLEISALSVPFLSSQTLCPHVKYFVFFFQADSHFYYFLHSYFPALHFSWYFLLFYIRYITQVLLCLNCSHSETLMGKKKNPRLSFSLTPLTAQEKKPKPKPNILQEQKVKDEQAEIAVWPVWLISTMNPESTYTQRQPDS